MNHRMTIAQICGAVESPLFDRKSARIDAKSELFNIFLLKKRDIKQAEEGFRQAQH